MARHPSFQAGDVHTGFIQQHFDELFPEEKVSDKLFIQAAISLLLNESNAAKRNSLIARNSSSPFSDSSNFRINYHETRVFKFKLNDEKVHKVIVKVEDDGYSVKLDHSDWHSVKASASTHPGRFSIRSNIDGNFSNFSAVITPKNVAVFDENGKTEIEIVQPSFLKEAATVSGGDSSSVISPMPGILDKMFVKPGDSVKAGDPIAVIIGKDVINLKFIG